MSWQSIVADSQAPVETVDSDFQVALLAAVADFAAILWKRVRHKSVCLFSDFLVVAADFGRMIPDLVVRFRRIVARDIDALPPRVLASIAQSGQGTCETIQLV